MSEKTDCPYLDKWLQHDLYVKNKSFNTFIAAGEYAIIYNRFKVCAGLPMYPVKEYSPEDLAKLHDADVRYDILRKIGKSHDQAMKHLR